MFDETPVVKGKKGAPAKKVTHPGAVAGWTLAMRVTGCPITCDEVEVDSVSADGASASAAMVTKTHAKSNRLNRSVMSQILLSFVWYQHLAGFPTERPIWSVANLKL